MRQECAASRRLLLAVTALACAGAPLAHCNAILGNEPFKVGNEKDASLSGDGFPDEGSVVTANCETPLVACGKGCVDVRTDRDHCGRCARSCGPGRCTAGECEAGRLVLAGQATSIAATATRIFWHDGSIIWAVGKDGTCAGSRCPVLHVDQAFAREPLTITSDNQYLYWLSPPGPMGTSSTGITDALGPIGGAARRSRRRRTERGLTRSRDDVGAMADAGLWSRRFGGAFRFGCGDRGSSFRR